MKTIVLTVEGLEGELKIDYNTKGVMTNLSMTIEMSETQLDYLSRNFPIYERMVVELLEKSKTIRGYIINHEPTFEQFWNEYDYKMDKPKAAKEWQKLTLLEKQKCMESVKHYKYFLGFKKIATVYAERYLKNKNWDNDYRRLAR